MPESNPTFPHPFYQAIMRLFDQEEWPYEVVPLEEDEAMLLVSSVDLQNGRVPCNVVCQPRGAASSICRYAADGG